LDNKKAHWVSGLCGVAFGVAVRSQRPPQSVIYWMIGRDQNNQYGAIECVCVEVGCEHDNNFEVALLESQEIFRGYDRICGVME
jgi:hypothetical protein